MALFGESIKRIAQKMQTCEEWIEMVRDLREPIDPGKPPANLHMRWAEKGDLFAIAALEGFVKETDFMEDSLHKGDRCLLLEEGRHLRAFAWATFRDFKMALWYTLKLPPGWSYLEYIFVHPAVAGQGVGSYFSDLCSWPFAIRDSPIWSLECTATGRSPSAFIPEWVFATIDG